MSEEMPIVEPEQLHALLRFARKLLGDAFDNDSFTPEDIQDAAEESGLLLKAQYDPEKHGTDGLEYAEPGDDWYEYAPWFDNMLAHLKLLESLGESAEHA